MAVREKANKWFGDCVKREKHRRNKCTLKQGQTREKEQDRQLPTHYSHCCYCIKVFYDAKFLVKHVLRRHSDKLIELHKNFVSRMKSEKDIRETPDLVGFLKSEFSGLKVEVDYIKKALADHIQEKNQSMRERKNDHKPCYHKKCPNFDGISISTKNDSLKDDDAETSSKIVSNQISVVDFQNLQIRVDKLFQMYRETMALKEDIEKTLVLNEKRICKTLKNELLAEIQSILLNEQKKNRDEYEARYIELQREVEKLEKVVELNSKKIESPDCFREIQSKFESKIQNLLTGHSLFNSKPKLNKMDKDRNSSNDQKLALHKSKRLTKSIYTYKSVHNKSDLSGISKNKGLQSPWSHRKKHKYCKDTSHKNKKSILFSSENNQPKISEQEKHHELNSLVNNSETFADNHIEEAQLIMEEKLRSLNIDPNAATLSNEEFEKKMRLINMEKELLEKKYENFSQIHKELDNHVNKLVKSKLKRKLPKKIRFSDSFDSSSDTFDHDSSIKIPCTAQKQESLGFLLSSDLNAQGDSCKNFNVENLPPIQEHIEVVSEGSYSSYIQQPQQTEFESIRKCSPPASPVSYVGEKNIAKKSTGSFLLKSVEEMSDLSSLESDILEDECDILQGTV